MTKRIPLFLICLIQLFATVSCSPSKPSANPDSISPFYSRCENEENRIRAENRALVSQALHLMKEGELIRADAAFEPEHKNKCGAVHGRYKLRRRDNRLQIELKVDLAVSHEDKSPTTLEKGIAKIRACSDEFRSYFSRYDLDFQYQLVTTSNSETDHTVWITDTTGRSSSHHYYLGDPAFCSMVLHEFGHLMGLNDEYKEEGTCRDQASTETCPYSVMNNHRSGRDELMPRHMRSILRPVFSAAPRLERFKLVALRDVPLNLFDPQPFRTHDLFNRVWPTRESSQFLPHLNENECGISFEFQKGAQGIIRAGTEYPLKPTNKLIPLRKIDGSTWLKGIFINFDSTNDQTLRFFQCAMHDMKANELVPLLNSRLYPDFAIEAQ